MSGTSVEISSFITCLLQAKSWKDIIHKCQRNQFYTNEIAILTFRNLKSNKYWQDKSANIIYQNLPVFSCTYHNTLLSLQEIQVCIFVDFYTFFSVSVNDPNMQFK